MTNESWLARLRRCLLVCAALCLPFGAGEVAAQAPLRAALFKTAAEQSSLTQLAAAFDPVLADRLGKVAQVSIVATPALDLPSLQLAIDCVGETPSCLALATERSQADALLSPSLSRTDTEVVLSLLFFDPHAAGSMRVASKRVPRSGGDSAVLSAAGSLVRELFGDGTPSAATQPAPVTPAAPLNESQAAPPATVDYSFQPTARSASLVLPISLAVVGAIGIGAGIAFGVAAKNGEHGYGAQRVTNTSDAARADDRYDSASRSALISNVSFGVGAAALVAAAVVWIVQRPKHDSDVLSATHTRLALEPGRLSLTGGWR